MAWYVLLLRFCFPKGASESLHSWDVLKLQSVSKAIFQPTLVFITNRLGQHTCASGSSTC